MTLFELRCTAYLKKDIPFELSFEVLSKYISFSMSIGNLLEFHNKTGYKHFSFGGFYPIEKEKIYKKGSSYSFTIRSFSSELISQLSTLLRQNINNEYLIVVNTKMLTMNAKHIGELYSVSPVVTTLDSKKFWTLRDSGDIMLLQKQLHDNLEKKYKSYFDDEITTTQNFIQLIEIKNHAPQIIKIYKDGIDIRFFGNKFRIVPNEDEASQKLAFTALACGIGEKNSYGGGFCLARGMG